MKACYEIDPQNVNSYSKALQEAEIDLVRIGMSNDGSVGFLQPGTPLEDTTNKPVVEVTLGEVLKRQLVDDGRFAGFEETPNKGGDHRSSGAAEGAGCQLCGIRYQ
ncbi:hypothetical protein LSH36_477g02012 [Paralvinella palmiformis]|uniref:Uncharacterized protein n=1 Tax=Paralvinella palmiformis TaxID=53620 RepID=A0AAD9J937_9ANNE|nr:hypothetical protein LSH36_477g02012 [Paralvinella palmiformis]